MNLECVCINNNFDIKKKIVQKGGSAVFKNWKQLVPSLTETEFLDNLEWLCSDPGVMVEGRWIATREIGLTPAGIVHLQRTREGCLTYFRYMNGRLWYGASFRVPLTDKDASKYGVSEMNMVYKISLSPYDRV